MSNRDDSLDIFLQNLDAINDFCDARVNDKGETNACKDCVLNDYCLNIPSRESCKAMANNVGKCIELIRKAKEEKENDPNKTV